MKIERLTIDDIDQIVEIEKEVFIDPWNINIFKDELNNPFRIYLGLKDNEKLIGYGGISINFEDADLMNIAICNAYQGRGYGEKLLKELINIAKEYNLHSMFLEVRVSNKAKNLYDKLGFKINRLRKAYYENGEDAYEMVKEL